MLGLAAEGNYVAVRPSGTEPKVKFYMFAYAPPAESQDVDAARKMLEERLDAMEADLRKFAGVE
jgi:phosphoglucomutase/phosphomannomutase